MGITSFFKDLEDKVRDPIKKTGEFFGTGGLSSIADPLLEVIGNPFKPPPLPPPPDIPGAVKEQGIANQEAARIQGRLNNPNVINPFGTQTVTYNGDQPTVTQTLSPEMQAILNTDLQGRQAMGNLALDTTNRAGQIFSQDLDLSGAPEIGTGAGTRAKVREAMLSRFNVDSGRDREAVASRLIASGIPQGSEAFNREMERLDRQQVDARYGADLAAGQEASREFGMNSEARRQAIAEKLLQRQTPLNEIAAFRSGSQVSNPFAVPQYAQNANVAPAPVFAGSQLMNQYNMDVYNQQQASRNALLGGVFDLAGAGVGAMAGM